ncbi:MAG TPA: hypothetical protein VLG47_05500 [Candidatus Saccharimonadales bacterium]|nr:hypothetical protein [Candidatus Saccharimonadales bacterium]
MRKTKKFSRSSSNRLFSARRKTNTTRKKSAHYAAKARIKAARPVHRRIMLHPITVLFLLFAGVIIVGMTLKSSAATYDVHGKVAAAALTDGAVITSPADGTNFTTATQSVSGTCPDNSYVKVYVNNTFAGVAWCNAQQFEVQISLYTGHNDLRAQDYNVTDDPGPTTPVISVTYTPPAPPPPPPSPPPNTITGSAGTPITVQGNDGSYSGSGNANDSAPLLLTSDFHYQTFVTGSEFKWSVDLRGGVAPYTVHIDWGDSQHSTLVFKKAAVFWIQHTYTQGGYYKINIQSVDAVGTTRTVQLAALIKKAGDASIFSLQNNNGNGTSSTATTHSWWHNWIWAAWPIYLILLLMATTFWLGERQEYKKLMNRPTLKKRYSHR